MRVRSGVTAGLVALGVVSAAVAVRAAPPGPRDPDWPCQQIKVTQLSVAALWGGPPLEQAQAHWRDDPEVAALVARLAQRRVSLEQAKTEIAAFADKAGAQRRDRLTALFAGLFATLDGERSTVVNGLDRYGNRQKTLADKVRGEADALHAEQAAATPDEGKLATLGNEIGWDTRVFEDRGTSIRYACDVPNIVEQRLFALSQAIQAALE
jgi:hypothetical protein